MTEFVYDDVISGEEMMRGERLEREVEIYESADSVRGHDPNAQLQDLVCYHC
ncbi:antigen like protein [Clarias magur]|uniref:Antigen like protein n=1 Tax=Clarias magur TaxID=1594786 RepID=A0A8J4X5U5_CLAMG|nr:antigen like protein [Clarias magur]